MTVPCIDNLGLVCDAFSNDLSTKCMQYVQGKGSLRVEMTLKSSAVSGEAEADSSSSEEEDEAQDGQPSKKRSISWKTLEKGMVCDGRVKSVKDFGVREYESASRTIDLLK